MIKKEEAEGWLEKNAPHIKILEWRHDGNKSRFIDVNRGVEFERRFSIVKTKLISTPAVLFGGSKEEIQEKIRKTNMEKYGSPCSMQNDLVKNKRAATNIERYGVSCTLRNNNVQKKALRTNMERYGVCNPIQNEVIKNKRERSNIEKYGVPCTLSADKIKNKSKCTVFENYGVDHHFKSKTVREGIKKTMLERYGVENASQSESLQEKIMETKHEKGKLIKVDGKTLSEIATEKDCSYVTLQQHHKKFGPIAVRDYKKNEHRGQKYLEVVVREACTSVKIFSEHSTPWKTENNYPQRFDIFIPELNLAIEYHGGQHYEPIEYFGGDKTFAKTRKLDSYKREMCKKNGIKLIEIKYDELKYDESDIEMIRDKIDG